MDKVMLDIDAQVQAALAKTLKDKEKCEELLKKATGDQAHKLDLTYSNLKFRAQRLSICSDIICGRAYTVVEKDKELFVQKGGDARLISLAEKMGLSKEFMQQGKLET